MSGNPYSAPRSSVADVAERTLRGRPTQIVIAVVLLSVSFLVNLWALVAAWNAIDAAMPGFVRVFTTVATALWALVIWKIHQGRNWARIVYLVMFCLGLPRFVRELQLVISEMPSLVIFSLAQVGAQFTAIVLMFAPPGRDWFRRPSGRRLRRVFSYGSLRREDVQQATFGRSIVTHPDELVGFERAVSRNGEHANVIQSANPDSRVDGMLLELSDDELARADVFEVNDGYRRIEVTLASGVNAWMYVERDTARLA